MPFGASTFDITGSTAQVDQKHADAVAMKHNMVRYINWLPHASAANSEFNATYWNIIDYGLNRAIGDGLKVLLDLSDIQGISDARGYTFGDANNLALWQSVVSWLGTRVNSVNSRVYKNDDTIGIISIVGEATGLSNSEAIRIYGAISGYFKTAGFQQLIQSGGCAKEIFNAVSSISTVDCNCIHTYDAVSSDDFYMRTVFQPAAVQYGKPWFIEEFGATQGTGDIGRSNYLRLKYNVGLLYGCAGFLFWNNDEGAGAGGFGISSQVTPVTANLVKLYSYIKSYSPRIPVDAVSSSGWY